MSLEQTILGRILAPRANGSVMYLPDGAMHCDAKGVIDFIGPAAELPRSMAVTPRKVGGIVIPPFVDAHIHIPQHPIRGHFIDGIDGNPPEGRLLAGLYRNVFPAEARCADVEVARATVEAFARETLSQGVVGGMAYMTVHADATHVALERLGEMWSVGLVLMEMNCPEYLRTDASKAEAQMRELADRFGKRYVVTDRFAVAVGSELRRLAARVASDRHLRMQTHLNEQLREKAFVEKQLYPAHASYTHVYHDDGLLDQRAILAHCIHMSDAELELVSGSGSVIAHCPTSNTLLCSGIMPLDRVIERGINYAICTDVGASPTTSMLAEMAQFLKVHAGRSKHATPNEALHRATLAAAEVAGVDAGLLDVGRPMSFIEVASADERYADADDAILRGLLELSPVELSANREAYDALQAARLEMGPLFDGLDRDIRRTAVKMEKKVLAVTVAGREIWRRNAANPV